jgi:hypothetical protein
MNRIFGIIICLGMLLLSCTSHKSPASDQNISIISWGGISAENADMLYALAKECGIDIHLGLYRTQESALASMDAAARAGIGIIINFPQIKDSTEQAVRMIKDHPALFAYHIKDEPDTSDFGWLESLCDKIGELDPSHPCYINLLPNWAWGVEDYSDKIESFASKIEVPFYSFDHYPIIEADGEIKIRDEWYRNLEEFSEMARSHGKPFWGFALVKSHSITDPWPDTTYPEPTLGHLRLQVFSNLLYGAQAIQYFNFLALVDHVTCTRKPLFNIVRQVNNQVRAVSHVFIGCDVMRVWHMGDEIPSGTRRLDVMPHKSLEHIKLCGEGAVISLIENHGRTYLAIQNRDCLNSAMLDIRFSKSVKILTSQSYQRFDDKPITLEPGNLVIFEL